MTNTFSGIRPVDLPGFIAGELFGAVAALLFMGWLLRGEGNPDGVVKEAQLERDDLSQSGLRYVAQYAGDNSAKRRANRGHRVFEDASEPGAAGRID
jgi:hypothetical protein